MMSGNSKQFLSRIEQNIDSKNPDYWYALAEELNTQDYPFNLHINLLSPLFNMYLTLLKTKSLSKYKKYLIMTENDDKVSNYNAVRIEDNEYLFILSPPDQLGVLSITTEIFKFEENFFEEVSLAVIFPKNCRLITT